MLTNNSGLQIDLPVERRMVVNPAFEPSVHSFSVNHFFNFSLLINKKIYGNLSSNYRIRGLKIMYNYVDTMHQEYEDYYGFVYLILDQKTNKVYVGQKKGKTYSEKSLRYFGSGTIISSIRKHRGVYFLNKIILGVCYSAKELTECETECKHFFNSFDPLYGYNIAEVDKSPMLNRKHTDYSKKKMSTSATGRFLSDEAKKKVGDFNKGKVVSEETKIKMRESHLSRPMIKCPYCNKEASVIVVMRKYHFDNCIKNPINKDRDFKTERALSPEKRLQISKSKKGNAYRKGMKNSTEARKKISEALKKSPKIICNHCGKICNALNAKRWHLDNCKKNPINKDRDFKAERTSSFKGIPRTDEVKRKISETLKNKKG